MRRRIRKRRGNIHRPPVCLYIRYGTLGLWLTPSSFIIAKVNLLSLTWNHETRPNIGGKLWHHVQVSDGQLKRANKILWQLELSCGRVIDDLLISKISLDLQFLVGMTTVMLDWTWRLRVVLGSVKRMQQGIYSRNTKPRSPKLVRHKDWSSLPADKNQQTH